MNDKKILLVDDSSYMRGVLKNILKKAGFDSFVEASDGASAVEAYERERPDLVLMDIVMPKKSGIDALRDIKQSDEAAHVVMVSAVGQDVIIDEARRAGAEAFIVKPFQPDQVRETVDRVLAGGIGP